ncbi:MAG TPA: hypothetical protein VL981_03050 [Candidatus Methylacidiphilales bacterium]|nr:hypothetical protein [Candidatus Methylacidiphilales bacterium]
MSYFQFHRMAATVIAAILALNLLMNQLYAHGFEGDRFFPPTIQTDDPFATDEFSLGFQCFNDPAGSDGTPKTREIDVSSEFDKEIFPKFAVGVSGTYINLDPQDHLAPAQDGFDNIELSAKYQLWEVPEHEWILSLGCLADLGDTGSKALGVDSFSTYTPTVYFGKGFGDLPDELKYIKPIALTGTVGVAIPGQSANFDGSFNSDALQWGIAVEYSMLYLQQSVEDVGMPKPFSQMIPLVEFSMNTPFDRSGQTTTGTINPGVLWESKYCQLGAEAVIPVNGHTGPNVGAVFQVQIFIDDIWPKVFGHPVFFNDDNQGNK